MNPYGRFNMHKLRPASLSCVLVMSKPFLRLAKYHSLLCALAHTEQQSCPFGLLLRIVPLQLLARRAGMLLEASMGL